MSGRDPFHEMKIMNSKNENEKLNKTKIKTKLRDKTSTEWWYNTSFDWWLVLVAVWSSLISLDVDDDCKLPKKFSTFGPYRVFVVAVVVINATDAYMAMASTPQAKNVFSSAIKLHAQSDIYSQHSMDRARYSTHSSGKQIRYSEENSLWILCGLITFHGWHGLSCSMLFQVKPLFLCLYFLSRDPRQ